MDGHRRRRRAALLAAATGALSLTFLDQTAVSVALPAIQDDLGACAREAAWVINIYALAPAVLIAAAGRLGDRLGTARVLAGGLTVFAAASVGCAPAPDPGWLIAARAVQGAGAAARCCRRPPPWSPMRSDRTSAATRWGCRSGSRRPCSRSARWSVTELANPDGPRVL